jgi:hypothetical protein
MSRVPLVQFSFFGSVYPSRHNLNDRIEGLMEKGAAISRTPAATGQIRCFVCRE